MNAQTMLQPKRITQTELGPKGNCQSACLAMMLGCELSEVPNFAALYGDPNDYAAAMSEWLAKRGLFIMTVVRWQGVLWPPQGFYIAGGLSPRGHRHAVIIKNGMLWHDPHPEGGGIAEIDDIDLILPIGFRPASERPAATGGRDKIARAFLFEVGMFDNPAEIAANPDNQWVRAAYRAANAILALSDLTAPVDVREALQALLECRDFIVELKAGGALDNTWGGSRTLAHADDLIANADSALPQSPSPGVGVSPYPKSDQLGRRIDPAPMPEALKDTIATCYGLLWEVETDNKRVHRARRGLLQWLTKDEQARGIEMARAIASMVGLPPPQEPGAVTAHTRAERSQVEFLNLYFFIQYRRKDDGGHWINMAAFDVRGPAEKYFKEQSCDEDWPWEYQLVDLESGVIAKPSWENLRHIYPRIYDLEHEARRASTTSTMRQEGGE